MRTKSIVDPFDFGAKNVPVIYFFIIQKEMEHLPQLSFFLCDNVGLCLCHQGNDYSEAVCVCVCVRGFHCKSDDYTAEDSKQRW